MKMIQQVNPADATVYCPYCGHTRFNVEYCEATGWLAALFGRSYPERVELDCTACGATSWALPGDIKVKEK